MTKKVIDIKDMNFIQKRLHDLLVVQQVKKGKVIGDLGMNYPTLNKLIDDGTYQTIDKVKKICRALQLTPWEVLNMTPDDIGGAKK